jgi:hypothetical protein
MFGQASWADASTTSSNMRFYTVANNTFAERMRIDAAGNVGIGTSSPGVKLEVAGSVALGTSLTSGVGATTEDCSVEVGGNRGGNGNAYVDLHATSGTDYEARLIRAPGTNGEFNILNTGTGPFSITQENAAYLGFRTSNTERARIDADGNLLVGNTTAFYASSGRGLININGSSQALLGFGTSGVGRSYLGWNSNVFAMEAESGSDIKLNAIGANTVQMWTNNLERARIDGSGNAAIGTSPSAWGSGLRSLQVGNYSALTNSQGGFTWLSNNAYYDTDWKYLTTNRALYYAQDTADGGHKWYTSASGSANTTISFTQVMTLAANGNLGVGTVSPAYKLHVAGDGYFTGQLICGTTIVTGAGVSTQDTAMELGGQRLGDGNCYIDMHAASGTDYETRIFRAPGTNGELSLINTGTGGYKLINEGAAPIAFFTSLTERMRIDSSGNLLVGTTSASETSVPGIKLVPADAGVDTPKIRIVTSASTSGTAALAIYSTGAAAYRFYVDNAGTIFATSTTISAISDIRLKENVRELDAGLDTILALKPRRFDWKQGKGKDVRDDMGFIAQEVEEVLPELIGGWKAGEGEPDDLKSVKAGDLIPVLVKAIQELTARVAQLEERK